MNTFIVYSDGACSGNPGPGGWASVIIKNSTEVIELGGPDRSTTNNIMEMRGIIDALEWIQSQDISQITMYSDSSYVLNGVTKWMYGWKKRDWKTAEGKEVANRSYWERLYQLTSKIGSKKIQWFYVRGHTGVPGNERCDKISVDFSQNMYVDLYRGSLKNYSVDLITPPKTEPIPENNFSKPKSNGNSYYLILKNGVLERVKTWAECEVKVKGVPGVKFKKVSNTQEEQDVLKGWNYGS